MFPQLPPNGQSTSSDGAEGMYLYGSYCSVMARTFGAVPHRPVSQAWSAAAWLARPYMLKPDQLFTNEAVVAEEPMISALVPRLPSIGVGSWHEGLAVGHTRES